MINDAFYWDDLTELWIKFNQRGLKFIKSKFVFSGQKRTISAFSSQFDHANSWIIPRLKERTNYLISGQSDINYEHYITEKYIKNKPGEVLVSFGCGVGNHEILIAELNPELQVRGYDISKDLIINARLKADKKRLKNIEFFDSDIYKLEIKPESIDYFLFNASLHHFDKIESFTSKILYPALKKGGLVIINEYVGPDRLNFAKEQIDYCNQSLKRHISKENRKILGLNMYKNRCYRLGKWRMKISDPSECVDSSSIIPSLKKHFVEVELKNLGGNIVVPLFKHIAHHFVNKNQQELEEVIQSEDEYLKTHDSDYVFGIYRKDKTGF